MQAAMATGTRRKADQPLATYSRRTVSHTKRRLDETTAEVNVVKVKRPKHLAVGNIDSVQDDAAVASVAPRKPHVIAVSDHASPHLSAPTRSRRRLDHSADANGPAGPQKSKVIPKAESKLNGKAPGVPVPHHEDNTLSVDNGVASAPITDGSLANLQDPNSAAALSPPNSAPKTKHQQKVLNGIKHELDRLQPSDADRNVDDSSRRKLRSQESTGLKSELSAYFVEYDEVIGNVPKPANLLELDTPIVVHDSGATIPHDATDAHPPPFPVRSFGDHLATNFDGVQVREIDFGFLDSTPDSQDVTDPLPDEAYHQLHKRRYREEKQYKNIERNRSQHERERVTNILEDLQGQNWLRVLGVHGVVTEARCQQYEPARQHFIRKCRSILTKFKRWTDMEKSMKYSKDRAKSTSSSASPDPQKDGIGKGPRNHMYTEARFRPIRSSRSATQDTSDADDSGIGASISQQAHEDSAHRVRSSKNTSRARPVVIKLIQPTPGPPKPQVFTSFFSKPYQREAAIKGTGRGRNVLAWGLPVPEVEEAEFMLPEEYRDEETLKAQARRRRRDRRGVSRR